MLWGIFILIIKKRETRPLLCHFFLMALIRNFFPKTQNQVKCIKSFLQLINYAIHCNVHYKFMNIFITWIITISVIKENNNKNNISLKKPVQLTQSETVSEMSLTVTSPKFTYVSPNLIIWIAGENKSMQYLSPLKFTKNI